LIFLAAKIRFKPKEKLKKRETTTEANEKEEEKGRNFLKSRVDLFPRPFSLSLSPVQNVLLSRRPFLQLRHV
jgi:hypothetical protein